MVQGISFDGLASGLDTNDMIEQLMEVERISVRRLEVQKQETDAKQEIWQEVNQQLQNFDNSIDSLRQRETFESRVTNSEMENVMTADANQRANEANYRMNVQQLAQSHRVAGDQVGEILEGEEDPDVTTELGLNGSFTVNEAEITVAEEDGLRDIVNKINEAEDTGVEAFIMDNRLILNSVETGEDNIIALEDTDGDDILQQLGVLTDGETVANGENDNYANQLAEAQNSLFTIDGLEVERSTNTNIDDVVNNVSFDLHGTNEADEFFNLEVRNDIDQTAEAVSSFVEDYNNIQTFISEYSGEEDILQGDVTMRRLSTNLRRQVTNEVGIDGELTNVGDIGIQIDDEGHMTLDETEMRDAIRENPEEVQNLFRARESEDGADGVARRVRDRVQQYVRYSGILQRKDRSLDNQIGRIDDRIDRQERRLERREERLRSRFARMETTLNEVQAQGSWMQGQLQSLNLGMNNN